MNRRQGFLALEGFMLNAGMQDSPSPDDFGEDVAGFMASPRYPREFERSSKPSGNEEQGDLFSSSKPKGNKPTVVVEEAPKPHCEVPPPRLKPYSYEELLKIHCGNKAAAYYWFKRQQENLYPEKE